MGRAACPREQFVDADEQRFSLVEHVELSLAPASQFLWSEVERERNGFLDVERER